MNRRMFVSGSAASLAILTFPTLSTATEVIDPKLTALFGEDWETHKVTLGDYVDAWDAVFGAYTDPEGGRERTYRIPDVASIGLDVEDTGQVSGITLFPFNTATNCDCTPDTNDDRRWTTEQSETVIANLLPADAVFGPFCGSAIGTEDIGITIYVESMGTSEELYAKVLPETYAGTMDETPTQGTFGLRVAVETDDGEATDRVEHVSLFLETWDLDC